MTMSVLLLSTVHPPSDPRIVHKIVPALTKNYKVYACLPHAKESMDGQNDVTMIRLPHFRSLYNRIWLSHPLVLWKCFRLKPSIVHIFVPELIPIAFFFSWFGAEIIYEVQENLYKKFSIKSYNNSWLFKKLFHYFDHLARRKFHLIFTENAYLGEYQHLKYPNAVIHNYVSLPFIEQFYRKGEPNIPPVFYYCGVISMERCFDTMVKAFVILKKRVADFKVYFFGPVRFSASEAEQIPGFDIVKDHFEFYGYTDLRVTLKHATGSTAGIALLKPVADYMDSYPTKLFEYMAMELPVITSDFPLYKNVVERTNSGFCISPFDHEKLAEQLFWLIQNPEGAKLLGKNGKTAVKSEYNWTNEEKILLSFYEKIEVKEHLTNL